MENIETLKSLFSSDIKLNDDDFKKVYNSMIEELTVNEILLRFDFVRINFRALCENTYKKFPDICKEEIEKTSRLFSGFYCKPIQRIRSYSYSKIE